MQIAKRGLDPYAVLEEPKEPASGGSRKVLATMFSDSKPRMARELILK